MSEPSCRLERMFDGFDEWIGNARVRMAQYAATRRQIEVLEAQSAVELADVVTAYRWPDEPIPDIPDAYRPEQIGEHQYGEDLVCELAVVGKTSIGAAQYVTEQVAILVDHLPACWEKVINSEAPLWQARRVADSCQGLAAEAWEIVDGMVAPCLGAVGSVRLSRMVTAAIATADPEFLARRAKVAARRCVRVGGDEVDPLTGWVSARVDRADALFLDATVQLVADILAQQGDPSDVDERRARALGLLANPAAVVQLIGVHSNRGLTPDPPQSTGLVQSVGRTQNTELAQDAGLVQDTSIKHGIVCADGLESGGVRSGLHGPGVATDHANGHGTADADHQMLMTTGGHPTKETLSPDTIDAGQLVVAADHQAIMSLADKLAPVLTPHTQVYVHVCADTLTNPDAVARVESIGPVLVSQISQLTQGTRVRVTPLIHLGATDIGVDQYEIPQRIREHVILRDTYEVFPWSSREARTLDMDHTIPYQPGRGRSRQTTPSNLGPLSRKVHRVKTHAGWQLDQPQPGTFVWHTPAGQRVLVNHTGSHVIPDQDEHPIQGYGDHPIRDRQ